MAAARIPALLAWCALPLVAGCDSGDRTAGPQPVNSGEAQAIAEAREMLDARDSVDAEPEDEAVPAD